MSLWSIIGTAAGAALGGPAGAAIGAQIGGGIDANNARQDSAEAANQFSAEQYATRYQTQVKDMQAAGLNPMLAYMQSPGSSPVGQQYQVSNIAEGAANAYSSASNVERAGRKIEAETENVDADTVKKRAERYLVEAQTSLSNASADQARATVNKLEYESRRISEEIKNIPLEGDRLVALVENLGASTKLIGLQASTERERANQMKWLAVKTLVESDLLTLDRDVQMKLHNLGKVSQQWKPLVEMILGIVRTFWR